MAGKRDNNVSNIRARLQMPAASASSNPALDQPAEVVEPVPKLLTLDQLRPYDRNPRHTPNAKYAELKASIRALGLIQQLTVTRRPSDPAGLYMVEGGGNTRLAILRELYADTGELRFYRLHVLVVPWVSEIHIYAKHLAENEEEHRAPLLMIDKAMALVELRELIEADTKQALSQRAFIERLNGLGLEPISRRQYDRLEYIRTLVDHLPLALRAGDGLGGREIDALQALEKLTREVLAEEDKERKTDFEGIWSAALREYDDEWGFDLPNFEATLTVRLAAALGVHVGDYEAMLESVQSRRARARREASTVEPVASPQPAPAVVDMQPSPPLPHQPLAGSAAQPVTNTAPVAGTEPAAAAVVAIDDVTPAATPIVEPPARTIPVTAQKASHEPSAPSGQASDTMAFHLPEPLRERLVQAREKLRTTVLAGGNIDPPLANLGMLAMRSEDDHKYMALGYVAAQVAKIIAWRSGLPEACVIEDARSPAGFWMELPSVADGRRAPMEFSFDALRVSGLPVALEWPVYVGDRDTALDPELEMQRNWWWYLYGLAGAAIPQHLSTTAIVQQAQALSKIGSLQLYRACYLLSPYCANACNHLLGKQDAVDQETSTPDEMALRAVENRFMAAVGGPSLAGLPLWVCTLPIEDHLCSSVLAMMVRQRAC